MEESGREVEVRAGRGEANSMGVSNGDSEGFGIVRSGVSSEMVGATVVGEWD